MGDQFSAAGVREGSIPPDQITVTRSLAHSLSDRRRATTAQPRTSAIEAGTEPRRPMTATVSGNSSLSGERRLTLRNGSSRQLSARFVRVDDIYDAVQQSKFLEFAGDVEGQDVRDTLIKDPRGCGG